MYMSLPQKAGARVAMVAVLIVAGWQAAWLGCSRSAARTGLSRADSEHAIHSHDLQRAMRKLNRQASSPEAVRAESMSGPTQFDMSRVSKTAEQIGTTAERLPELIRTVQMSTEDRQAFVQYAMQLRDGANQLKTHADQNNLAGVRAAMHQVNDTCASCHAIYR